MVLWEVSLEKGSSLPPLPNEGCRFGTPGARPEGQAVGWTRAASLGSVALVSPVPISPVSLVALGPQPEAPGLFWI